MFILRAIGNFFVRIGRWIKNTAWIQPLLIVGGIFAIIFSIPYITKWVGSWFSSSSASEKYYSSHKLSLKGAEDRKSDVDKLFTYITDHDNADKATANKFGEKFFVTLVQDGCSACDERYGGFKTLEENWGKGEFANLDGKFKLYTIYVDSKNKDGDNLFEKVYNREDVVGMFERSIENMQNPDEHPYARNSSNSSSYASELENIVIPDQISTPTTLLVDFTAQGKEVAPWTTSNGIREILFSFESTSGSDDYAKARTLRNAWTNVADATNVFSTAYKK